MRTRHVLLPWLGLLVLAGLFLLAGVPKAIDPTRFLLSLEGYRLVSGPLLRWVAVYLPWVEILTAGALLIPATRSGALAMVGLLLGLFSAAIVSVWVRGIDIDCGCFSSILPDAGYAFSLLRNAGLLLLAAALLVAESKRIRAA